MNSPGSDLNRSKPENAPADGVQTLPAPGGSPELSERAIDEYRLIELIGEGGMGEVYKAEQRGAIRRTVALKVIKLGLDTKLVIARFEAERQALALMNHPSIARVFGAGSTPLGRPYFVMEYVPGKSITAYCDQHKLPIPARLELFAKVCEAIQHAHTKGIIHRDLKASNVLVTEVDGQPVPKVIDFGVAKAVNQRLTERTLFTEMGRMVGTPEYMSPEQAEGGADVDTRSDVYSLGVLLYELLTGSLPFDGETLRRAAYQEIVRIIREDDPPRPSTFYSRPTIASQDAAQRRAATVDELARTLRHELEWIPLHAMRKERSERYQTAAELGRDIANYLDSKPLIAGPDSGFYRLKKTIKRNQGAFAAAAGIMLALTLGMAGTTWQMFEAREAEARARDSAALAKESDRLAQQKAADAVTAQKLADDQKQVAQRQRSRAEDRLARQQAAAHFIYDVFARFAEIAQPEDNSAILEVVDGAAGRVEQDFPNPASRAGYLRMIADVYLALGEYKRAAPLYEQSVGFARQVLADASGSPEELADNDYEVVRSLTETCQSYSRYFIGIGDGEEAVALAREAHEAAKLTPDTHAERAIAEGNLGNALRVAGEIDEAETLLTSARQRMATTPGEFGFEQVASVTGNLAAINYSREKFAEAELGYAQAARILEDNHSQTTTQYALFMQNRAVIAIRLSKPQAALDHLDVCTRIRDRTLGSQHPDRQVEWEIRARIYEDLGRPDDARKARERTLQIGEAAENPKYLIGACQRWSEMLRRAGRETEAAEWDSKREQYLAQAAASTRPATDSQQ